MLAFCNLFYLAERWQNVPTATRFLANQPFAKSNQSKLPQALSVISCVSFFISGSFRNDRFLQLLIFVTIKRTIIIFFSNRLIYDVRFEYNTVFYETKFHLINILAEDIIFLFLLYKFIILVFLTWNFLIRNVIKFK